VLPGRGHETGGTAQWGGHCAAVPRLIVDGGLPRTAAIAHGPAPLQARSAIWMRSGSDKNRAEMVRLANGCNVARSSLCHPCNAP
jgi:hypothetical protein